MIPRPAAVIGGRAVVDADKIIFKLLYKWYFTLFGQ